MPARTLLAAAVALLLAAVLAPAAHAAPAASAAKSCATPKYPGQGYFTSLKVKGTGCAKGRKVALAHHDCRTEDGPKGRCTRKVRRYRCSETRGAAIPTEYNARVTCRKGARRVVFTYQQNL